MKKKKLLFSVFLICLLVGCGTEGTEQPEPTPTKVLEAEVSTPQEIISVTP